MPSPEKPGIISPSESFPGFLRGLICLLRYVIIQSESIEGQVRGMKRLYVIGGTMGVGKTSVCRQLKQDLPNCVFLDGDWCWDASPFQVTGETKTMVLDNICHVLNNFLHCSAYESILFCWVLHQQSILDAILKNLDLQNCRVTAISLTADEKTLRERLERDVRKGLRTPDVIGRSLERLPLYDSLDTIKIDTTGKSIPMVAAEIRRR